MGRSTRLLLLLRPYTPLFIVNLVATVVASVLDGVTFVLLIPFLRTLFGQEPLLAAVVGPVLGAGAPHRAGQRRAGAPGHAGAQERAGLRRGAHERVHPG